MYILWMGLNSLGRFCAHLITSQPVDGAESYDLHKIRVLVNKRLQITYNVV